MGVGSRPFSGWWGPPGLTRGRPRASVPRNSRYPRGEEAIMKRTCLISSALALTVLAPTMASAEPGILYIPTDPITLLPTGVAPCSGVNSALGCGGVDAETEIAPYSDAAGLTTAISDAVAEYDVLVTNT